MRTTYLQPANIAGTLLLLAQYGDQSRLINGGTDLLIEIERRLRAPKVIIDVSRIAGLAEIHVADGTVRLGAGVTHNQVVAHSLLRERVYALTRACWEVGAPQIRNRGTLAGNLVTASPANDSITPLWALGSAVTLKSLRGERTLAFPEFFKGVRKTALAPDEMLTAITFPLPPPGTRSTFLKLGLRRAQAISVVNVAVLVEYEDDLQSSIPGSGALPTIRRANITMGSVAPTIVAARAAEQWLTGKSLTDDVIAEAGHLAVQAPTPIDDVRGSAEYRREMVRVYVMRALRQLRAGTERADFPLQPVMLWGQIPALRHQPEAASSSPISNLDTPLTAAPTPIDTTVNGKKFSLPGGHDKTLLRFLREDLRLTGTKEGCAEGECGACTVFLDGAAVMSCLVPATRAHGAEVVTIEGINANGALHPVQRAFIDAGAVQCGYCTPGFVMSGAKLLEEVSSPSRSDIQHAFTGNLCRCTGYAKIVQAVMEI